MSDFDEEDVAEQLDDEVLGDEYPPDRYIDPDEPGVELPDVGPGGAEDEPDLVVLDDAVVEDDVGALADDDEFTGDETTRDVATERVPRPAEEAALHVLDEDDEEE
jgi:hypothetical protein